MRAFVTTRPAPESIESKTVPRPEPGPDEVLVRVKICSICGTDVHIYNWDAWAQKRITPPLIQGHEFAGEVVEVGSHVKNVREGDYVSAECHVACWRCVICRGGNPHICQNIKILGIDWDGGFAEYVKVPAINVIKNDEDLPLEYATIQDPLGNAIYTALETKIAGSHVAVFGLGPTGLLAVAVAKAVGAGHVIAVGRKNQFRMDLAKKVGADVVLREGSDLQENLLRETDGIGLDVVLEMSGSPEALNAGLRALRPGGEVSILGAYAKKVEVDVSKDIVFKGARVYGIHGRKMFETWEQMKGLLRARTLNLAPIITHRLKFDQLAQGMKIMQEGDCGKVVMLLEER